MQGRIGLLLAGAALAVGGGIAGAFVVAPQLVDTGGPSAVEVRQAAEKEELASLQHTFNVAKKARGMARGARQQGNGLVDQVNTLSTQTQQALNAASSANARLDASQAVSNTAAGQVTTDSETVYVPLSGGPQVTVTVPQSGLVEVFASVKVGNAGDPTVAADGAVALFEDGQKVPVTGNGDTFDFCEISPDLTTPLLFVDGSVGEEWTLSTPPSLGPGGCFTQGASPGGVLLNRSPGQHTYEFRYGDCGCEPEPAAFRDRVLHVIPHP